MILAFSGNRIKVATTSDMQMIALSNGRKQIGTKEPLDGGE